MSMNDIVKKLQQAVDRQANNAQPTAYDTPATVRRVEDGIAWVHLPGGVDETPVKQTIACSTGDTVQVRVSGGTAFIVGNGSAPPTDDKTAIKAATMAQTAETAAKEAKVTADGVNGIARTAQARATQAINLAEGIDEHFWYDSSGAHVTEAKQEDYLVDPSAAGGNTLITSQGMAIRNGTTNLGVFADTGIQTGQNGESRSIIDYHSLQLIDKDNVEYVWFSDLRDQNGVCQLIEDFTGDGSTTTFTLSWDVVSVDTVTINGSEITAYTVSDDDITFTNAPADGAAIVVIYSSDTDEAKAFTLGTRASGYYVGLMSTVEGETNVASGYCSHAEGSVTEANGHYSHAEGVYTEANGLGTHAHGLGTTADYAGQTVIGLFNDNQANSLFEIGNGQNNANRSNAFIVDYYGGVEAGALTLHGSGTVADPYYYTGGYNDEALMTLATRNKWHTILGEATE